MMTNTRILVADDDPAVLQTMAWVLKEQGYDVSAAHGGQALFERLEHDSPPDLLLLDVSLPGADNYQTLERIKSDERLEHIPVVILTTSHAEEDILRSYHLRANAFVTKPVDLDSFFKVIRSIEEFWLEIVRLGRP